MSLIREEICRYETAPKSSSGAEEEMRQTLYAYLSAAVDGEILSANYSVSESEGLLCVTLHAHCLENIARIREITQAES